MMGKSEIFWGEKGGRGLICGDMFFSWREEEVHFEGFLNVNVPPMFKIFS